MLKNSYYHHTKNIAPCYEKNDEYIEKCLAYAKNLVDKRLPIIYDEKHFSQLVGIDLDYLLSAANSPKHFYRYFTIPKRNGKIRKISEPLPVLKEAQYYILNNILKKVPCSIYAKAYKPRNENLSYNLP